MLIDRPNFLVSERGWLYFTLASRRAARWGRPEGAPGVSSEAGRGYRRIPETESPAPPGPGAVTVYVPQRANRLSFDATSHVRLRLQLFLLLLTLRVVVGSRTPLFGPLPAPQIGGSAWASMPRPGLGWRGRRTRPTCGRRVGRVGRASRSGCWGGGDGRRLRLAATGRVLDLTPSS